MGFGSYDESEQENQALDSDLDENTVDGGDDADHDGDIEFEFEASNDELLDKLEEIKD